MTALHNSEINRSSTARATTVAAMTTGAAATKVSLLSDDDTDLGFGQSASIAITDTGADIDSSHKDLVDTDELASLEDDTDDDTDDLQYSVQYSEKATASTRYRKASNDDAVGAFFKEMARYPLLQATEEIELARQVRIILEVENRSQALQEELGRKPTMAELASSFDCTEAQLKQRLRKARAAKRRMIRSNLRLVVSIAKRYLNRGVPFLDLIQEGALGLNRAADESLIPIRATSFRPMLTGGFVRALPAPSPMMLARFACPFTLSKSSIS